MGAPCYWYGYDAEHAKAFRAHHDGSHYELGEIEIPLHAKPYDSVWGVWGASKQPLPDLTVADWEAMQAARDARKSRGVATVHWSGETRLQEALILKDRADKHPLISLYENGQQILQAREGALPSKDEVVAVMREVSIMYAAGKVDKLALKTERDALLKQRNKVGEKLRKQHDKERGEGEVKAGDAVLRRATSKRPAAAAPLPRKRCAAADVPPDVFKIDGGVPEDSPKDEIEAQRKTALPEAVQERQLGWDDELPPETWLGDRFA